MATGQPKTKSMELMERLNRFLPSVYRNASAIAQIHEEALSLWSSDPGHASEILGIIASLTYDEVAAIEHFEQATRVLRNDPAVEHNYANSLVRLGRLPEARERIQIALSLAPANLDLIDTAIHIAAISGGFSRAAALLGQWSKLSHGSAHVWHHEIVHGLEYLAGKQITDSDVEQLVEIAMLVLREAKAELNAARIFIMADEETEWLSIHFMRAGPVKQIVDLNVRLAEVLAAEPQRPKASYDVTVMFTLYRNE